MVLIFGRVLSLRMVVKQLTIAFMLGVSMALPIQGNTRLLDSSVEANNDGAVKLQYEVIRNNKVIGQMQAIRVNKGSYTEYLTESSVKVSVVVDLAIYTKVSAIFGQGQLISGTVVRRVNNSNKVNATIQWQKDRYIIEEDGEKMTVQEKILYASACLMHLEPVGLTRIFSEANKKFIPIRQLKPHQYELQLPDGNKNFYTYADGICVSAEVNTTLSKAFFRLKK
jgi:hypothetical protein